jgi:hypothetical protein
VNGILACDEETFLPDETYDITTARGYFDAAAWQRAVDVYAAVDSLEPDDLERHAVAAFLLGRNEDFFRIREAEYRARLKRGDALGAARAAVWIGAPADKAGRGGTG